MACPPSRAVLVSRWLALTRTILPGLAAGEPGWPIRLDHCFMRVCLDHAVGQRWDSVVARPAIRNLDEATLRRAIALAERIAADPACLPALNRASLAMRRSPDARSGRHERGT